MYHNQSTKALKSTTLALVLSATAGFAYISTAEASSLESGRQIITQAKMNTLKGVDVNMIDWRQPEMKVRFDLSSNDWIDGVDLNLSMTPEQGVSRDAVVLVSLNNAPPVTLRPRGNSFDARIRLDSDYARANGNVLTIRVPSTSGQACLKPSDMAWNVNTKKSSIVLRTRAKSRTFYLNEVESRLSNPLLAPKTVGIVAKGAIQDRLQVLAAQGIALRMNDIPQFRMSAGRSDMDIIIGRRDMISNIIKDRNIIDETGPKVSVAKGRPVKLVITGDTDSQVLEAAKIFSERHLPKVRRTEASEGELRFQNAFDQGHNALSGRTKLSELNYGFYARDWSATPSQLTFNVDDPVAQDGQLLLRLNTGPDIDKSSRLDVTLNGHSLGHTSLDKARKTVGFKIPQGSLKGADNKLVMTPTFIRNKESDYSCPSWNDTPGFYIGDGSRIELNNTTPSFVTDLSRLTAGSSVFNLNDGKDTHIVLATGNQRDKAAALKVIAKLAKSSGSGWSEAEVSSLNQMANISPRDNIIVIGPLAKATGLLDDAPRVLKNALRGQATPGLVMGDQVERFAALNAESSFEMYAAKQTTKSRQIARTGGIAAIYPSPENTATLKAVISNTNATRFTTVSADLINADTWDELAGSVARWRKGDVLVAQTAIPAPNFVQPKSKHDTLPRFDMAALDFSKWDITTLEDMWNAVSDKTVLTAEASLEAIRSLPNRLANRESVNTDGRLQRVSAPVIDTQNKNDILFVPKTTRLEFEAMKETPVPRIKTRAERPVLTAELRGFSQVPMSFTSKEKTGIFTHIKQAVAASVAKLQSQKNTTSVKNRKTDDTLTSKITIAENNLPSLGAPKAETMVENIKSSFKSTKQDWNTSNTERKIRDFQDKTQPFGNKIKTTLGLNNKTVKSWMAKGDQTFGYYGLLLAFAFIMTVIGLGLVSPSAKDTDHC